MELVLGTRKERVRLLKAGVSGKVLEKMFIERNGFTIVGNNTLRTEVT